MPQKYNYCELRVLSFSIIIIFTDSAHRERNRMREGRVEWSIKDKFSDKFYIVSQPTIHTHNLKESFQQKLETWNDDDETLKKTWFSLFYKIYVEHISSSWR